MTFLVQAQVKTNKGIPNDIKLKSQTIGKYRLFKTTNN